MAALQRIEPTDTQRITQALTDDGACIVCGALARSLCRDLLKDFRPHLDAIGWGDDVLGYPDGFHGHRTKRLHGLFSKSKRMTDVLTRPVFLQAAEALLVDTGTARDYRLSNTELMVLGQGQQNQDFHTDAVSWERTQRQEPNELLVSANCALTDFTETNGATRVVPGSHRWRDGRPPRADEVCVATMPAGSALLYTGNVIHAGGANQEPDDRVGLYLGYVVSWLRPLENQLVTNAPADIAELPPDAQRLLDVVPGGFTVRA